MEKARILVVDDDDLVLESLKSELGLDYELVCANRASQALDVFRSQSFDCVISDVRMPGMDGLTLLREIGKQDPTVGRILITAYSDPGVREAALQEDGIFKVAKPWRDELEITVKRALELRSLRCNLRENVKKIDSGLEFDRQLRQKDSPRDILQTTLEFVLMLESVNRAEIWLTRQNEVSPQRIALAEKNKVLFETVHQIVGEVRAENHQALISRAGQLWKIELPLWSEDKGTWRIICHCRKLAQQDISWLEYFAERLVDAIERFVLVNRAKQQSPANTGQLMTLEKMSSIGLLASGVAHEISNPAGYVRSNLEVLDGYLEDIREVFETQKQLLCGQNETKAMTLPAWQEKENELTSALSECSDILVETREGIERIIAIASNLRSFARSGGQERKPFQVKSCIESSLAMIMYKYKTNLKVIQEHQPTPNVFGNPAEIGQILLNIMINAAQAMDGKGTIEIRSYPEQEWVKVSIKDNGPGIPLEIQDKIFEPLFTTKAPGQGTGLGLSISREIVHRHGGNISVISTPGQGAVFVVALPALDESERQDNATAAK